MEILTTQLSYTVGIFVILKYFYEPHHKKTCIQGFWSDPTKTQAVQPQKIVRGLKFRISGLCYLCSEDKGANRLICAFVFAYAKSWLSYDAAHLIFIILEMDRDICTLVSTRYLPSHATSEGCCPVGRDEV